VVGLRVAAVVLCALPWVAALHIAPGWFEHVVELTFLPLCHHWPARVLSFDGVPMCVCSRCAGLYAGLAIGFAFRAPSLSDRAYARILVVGLVVTVLDVITQDAGFHAPCHPVRLATGAWLGWTAASWMLATSSRRSRPEPLPG
jgi:uncharacterized membrane protein